MSGKHFGIGVSRRKCIIINNMHTYKLTNFGPVVKIDGIEAAVPDVRRTELVRVVVRRIGSLAQCVSTRGLTFFKPTAADVTVLLSMVIAFGFFVSARPRARFATKSPKAARRVVVVVVVVVARAFFFNAPSCASPRVIKFCVHESKREYR